jgi:hypothetical protein
MEECADAETRSRFAESIAGILQERAQKLDSSYFSAAGRRLESGYVSDVVSQRVALTETLAPLECALSFKPESMLFRDDGSLDLGEILGPESDCFFDYWETPPPTYWIDYKILSAEDRPDEWSILTSWIPSNVCDKAREWSSLSATGTLVWLDEVLAKPDRHGHQLASLARGFQSRIHRLNHLNGL